MTSLESTLKAAFDFSQLWGVISWQDFGTKTWLAFHYLKDYFGREMELPVRSHLKNVYSTLSIGMICAAVGACVHLFTNIMQAGLLTTIGSIGLLVWLSMTHHEKENVPKRLAIFAGFTALSGVSLGPLLQFAIDIEPSIVPTALMATSLIFVCFSISALITEQRYWLFLGGTLFSMLSWMLLASFANIFLRWKFIFEMELYLGLAIFCLFVLYDTQLIVEKRRRGDDDFIWHAVDLFIDFINIFRRLLIILASKEDQKKKRK